MIESAAAATVYIALVSVSAFGADHLVLPDDSTRKAFVNRDVCERAARRLGQRVKGSPFAGIHVNGAVCLPMEVLK